MLIHPTRGAVMVACRSVQLHDKLESDGGETTAELEFVEANTGFSGIFGSLFGIISTALSTTSQASFLRDYTPAQVSHPWQADIVDNAQSLVAATATEAIRVLTPESPQNDWRIALHMQEVAKDDGLALSAPTVDDAMSGGFKLITRTVVDPNYKFNTFRKLANAANTLTGLPYGPAVESDEAVVSRHRILAAIGMAEAAMGRKYVTIDECLAAKDMVMSVLNDEAAAAYAQCDNALYLEITKYGVEFSKMMYDLSYRLPAKVLVNFSGGVHPLVASYAIYNDAKRHRELEQRNIIDANGRIGPIVSGIAPA
jgi:hypothetical protein